MAEVRLSPRARRDLLDIWLHLAAEAGMATADRWIDRIELRCNQLADHPEMGPARPDIDPRARHLVIQRWLALYEIASDGIVVARIVDAKRDLLEIDLSDD